MDHSIQLPLDDCQRFYTAYLKSGVKTSQPLAFDPKKSANDNLRRLSVDALHPANTFGALYAYEPVFLDLICRWIDDPLIEADYCQSIGELKPVIEGVIVVNALTRLVGVHQESLNLIEGFISKANFFGKLQQNAKESSIAELEYILIAFLRLIDHDAPRFKNFIDPEILHRIINIDSSGAQVAKYLATMILCRYINASEHAQKVMLDKIENPIGSLEGDDSINFKYFHFLEAKRLNRFMNLPEKVPSSKSCIEIQESDFCSLVHLVCGRLIPKHSISDMKTTTDTSFVPTKEALNVIRNVTSHLLMNKPVILYGAAGSGKTYLVNQLAKRMGFHDSIVKVHLGDQTDAKILLGTYTSGPKPGSFEWRAGVLTTAVREGKWLLIEDIDRAPTEVLSVLLPLLENRKLSIPSRGEVIRAANGFQIIATIRTSDSKNIPDMIGIRNWTLVPVETPSDKNLKDIIQAKYPLLTDLIPYFIRAFNEVVQLYSSNAFISLNKGSNPRIVSIRDLMKLCARCNKILQNEMTSSVLESSTYDNVFAEVVDCFGSALTEQKALAPIVNTIGEVFEIPTSRVNLFLSKHVPAYNNGDHHLTIGRATLKKDTVGKSTKSVNAASFARTNHSLRLMEQIGAALLMTEPVLLVGETGTGKTTVVQQMAKLMNKKITVINVSQQTESSDLLGGYKPVTSKIMALPLQETFDELFSSTFSKKKNERFSNVLNKCFNKGQWKNVVKLWLESVKMARDVLQKQEPERSEDETPKKKRKLEIKDKAYLLERWCAFEEKARNFETHSSSLEDAFVFDFVEGSLVKAVRNGEWLLLDEINLASPDTLESIADLITDKLEERSLLLTEKGDINSINAHPEFRIFACMNPSTDIGKRDLPLSIRSRFSEIYVHSPDSDIQDLLAIIDKYVGRFSVTDEWLGNDIAELYLSAKKLADSNQIVDGANQRPHFSIRTLTRTLLYVSDIVNIYGVRRSLYEGFCMSFLTLLDSKSESILHPLIKQYTIDKLKNSNSVMRQTPPDPSNGTDKYVQFKHYWLPQGSFDIIPQPHYIITPFVEKNILNLVRATSGKRFPVLIQGPTSAGKTSMIQYLANISGHKFVRINNHEHTDLQEYLGTYVAVDGKLVFKEGILVEALKNGHWIVLDELNLAPTDVLEALNRLLDDNRELFIPETQEVVHPHPDFMLFATQNPPGIYGGRKILSRAFKNRFLELHFDDIPQDELETILTERCQIAPSYSKKIVEVYRQLSVQRQSTRLFEQKNSFATLRDLFRWALRGAVGYEELAAHGYMILAERVRVPEERETVSRILEKVMKVKLNMDSYYESLENKLLLQSESSLVWTKGMRKLAVLVATSMKYNEPLLLVGETGCGKTTVCQILAHFEGKSLVTVNAHQNTETSDLLGAQRPVRNKKGTNAALTSILQEILLQNGMVPSDDLIGSLLAVYDSLPKDKVDEEKRSEIKRLRHDLTNLFEWCDGPLVQAMKSGDFFLLDEISLADDSVLERLNSVLEPERSLLLAEKGTEVEPIYASSGFQFLATMNPGGDYGKKELSPALRNRFTEIWVPSMEDMNDTHQIVQSRLDTPFKQLCSPIIEFAKWYAMTFGGGRISSGVISLRDILAWVEFINHAQLDPPSALYHGSLMVFVDSLGTNNTSFLATNEQNLMLQKQSCIEKLSELAGCKFETEGNLELEITESHIKIGHFGIPKNQSPSLTEPFALHAPTTALNAMRVLRGMQVKKPILLEGSPGVGKTSLISALALASGNPLIRINLSEQTDLVDLFGSDVPTEGGKAGEFVWRDAPFLRAMKHGEWVLLDEMNLASQSVLEGLNACLDHRGTAYIPELGRSFPRHEKFTVFAAQNPQAQGGGRKGLPKSFVNRFTVVYVDTLKAEDLTLIAKHLYPTIDPEISKGIIDVISRIEKEVVIEKKWGQSGGPWEFNLRDTLRWLDMYSSRNLADDITPSDFLNMIVCQRFRTSKDQNMARACFEDVFGPLKRRDKYYNLTETFLQAGGCALARSEPVQYRSDEHLLPLQCNFEVMESALRSVVHNLPLILTGPSSSGKTSIVKFLGSILGRKVDIFAMNSDVDSTDILGGFEQVDLTKAVNNYIGEVIPFLHESLLASDLTNTKNSSITNLLKKLEQSQYDTTNFDQLLSALEGLELGHLAARGREISNKINLSKGIRFEWFDGLLVKAVQNGHWLILDNANLCSPSVLDRLNSLLERNGKLIINECSNEFGEPRVITPHPDFRLFLTTDPKYGELSRAMRNRGVEVFLNSLNARLTTFDRSLLGVEEQRRETEISEKFKMEERIEKLKLDEENRAGLSRIPLSACIHSELSTTRHLGVLHDMVMESSMTSVSLGALSPQTADDLKSLRDTIHSSKLFEADFELNVDSMIEEYTLLQGIDTHQQMVGYLNDFSEHLKRKGFSLSEFKNLQPLNPLLNTFVNITFNKEGLHVYGSESIYLFQALELLLHAREFVSSLLKTSMEKNAKDLTYLERSAAFELGRTLKKYPKVQIFRIMNELLSFIFEAFQGPSTMFKVPGAFEAISNFLILWNSLAESASGQNASKLPIYKELIQEWYDSVKSHWLPLNVNSLLHTLKSFEQDINMTTGLSMEVIWHGSRGNYPGSASSWEKAMRIVEISNNFDLVTRSLPFSSQMQELSRLLQEVFRDVSTNEVPDSEFNDLCTLLLDGITRLSSVNNYALQAQDFGTEYRFLFNFIMADNSSKLSLHDRIATKARAPTIKLIASSRDGKMPYPSVFDTLWNIDTSESFVDGMFTDKYLQALFSKVDNFTSCSGELLDGTYSEMIEVRQLSIENSESILRDKIQVFLKLLVQWYMHIIDLHKDVISKSSAALLSSITVEAAENFNLENLDLPVKEMFFIEVVVRYFGPAVRTALKAKDLSSLGKAWVLFSCGCIQLYVPNTPFDPAQKEHIAYNFMAHQKAVAEEVRSLWKTLRTTSYGDEPIIGEELIPNSNSELVKPQVFRFESSSDQLFEEWDSFMKSNIDSETVKGLLNSAESFSEKFLDMSRLFQNNSARFLVRLRDSFTVFSDLNDLLRGYVCGLKLGFDLLSIETENKSSPVPSISWTTNVNDLISSDRLSTSFESLRPFLKKQKPDSSLPEKTMKFFIKLCYTQRNCGKFDSVETVLENAFQFLYYRWTLRRLKAEEEEIQNNSLFKYSDESADIGDDFRNLFPDHEDVVDADQEVSKRNDSFDEIYYQISKDYMDAFSASREFNLEEIVEEGSSLSTFISKHATVASGNAEVGNFTALILQLSTSISAAQKRDEKLDFYHGYSTFEFKRALAIVNVTKKETMKLLAEWPEHLTLQCIARCCSEFANFPIKYSVSKLLQKVEQIYTYLVEWEKYAHSGVSLATQVNSIVELIISWRKLELQTWSSLFDHENYTLETSMGKWWFYLFEVLLLPTFGTEEVDHDSCTKIVSALNTFLGQTSYGEFGIRLKLIRSFEKHILTIDQTSPIASALANVISFYEQFVPVVDKAIKEKKKALEKDISEVILLARWKDVNPDALKQSARRSHNSLYKIVRKYRAVLASQISTLVELGLPVDQTLTVGGEVSNHNKISDVFYDSILTNISTWNDRPTRFRKLDRVVENMGKYILMLESQTYPNLTEYTTSLLGEMEKLRNETPKKLTKENKKTIAALKAQKSKLMSDTIKDIKSMGIKVALQTKVIAAQSTSSLVLATANTFKNTKFEGSDVYFFRILDLLPRLRVSISECNEEVPQPSVEKCMAAIENLVFTTTATRVPLGRFSRAFELFMDYKESFESLSETYDGNVSIVKATHRNSLMLNLESIKFNLYWVEKFISFVSSLQLELTPEMDKLLQKLGKIQMEALDLKRRLPHESTILTEASILWNDAYISFHEGAVEELTLLESDVPCLSFVAKTLQKLLADSTHTSFIQSSTSLESISSLEEIEKVLRSLSNAILIAVQNVKENNDSFDTEKEEWFQESQTNLFESIKRLNAALICKYMKRSLDLISRHEYNASTSAIVQALVKFTLPLVDQYGSLLQSFLSKSKSNYFENSKSTYILATCLHNIAVNGFCSPQADQEQKQDDNLQDGTGLGDGSGAAESTKDIDEEDLAEAAQEENKEKDNQDDEMDEEKDNAHDIEGDMAGDLEEAENDENDEQDQDEDEELDEEIDDLDDSDPNAVDEKMWDEQVEDDKMKEKESDEVPQNQDENLEGNDEDSKDKDEKSKDEAQADEMEDEPDADNKGEENSDEGEEENEEEQLGEQEDEVKNDDDGEALDDHVPESEVLDLPEDINLDSDGEQEEAEEAQQDDDMDMEDEQMPDSVDSAEEQEEGMEEEGMEEEGKEEEENEGEVEENAENDEDEEDAANEEDANEDMNSDVEELKNENAEEDLKADNASKLEAEGNDGADQDNDAEEINSDVKQESGNRGQGDDNEDTQENEDVGAAGGASLQMDQKDDSSNSNDDMKDEISESLKQLGDSLKEFHRRRQEIKEASERDEQLKETANENPDDFEHVDGDNADTDTQAMGSADKDQVQKIDEDKAMDQEDENEEVEVKEELSTKDEGAELENPEVKEDVEMEEESKNEDSIDGRIHLTFKNEQVFETDQNQVKVEDMDEEEEEIEEEVNMEIQKPSTEQSAVIEYETALKLWSTSEQATQELASGLCEQLRLILEPTMSTKLKGDYKTGKRLNMKRIIPYIASDFRKDKIWLRRTKPSKRQYQIMIAVDDSKSMTESNSHELAFHSIALVSKALTQLESGEISIVRFGEDVKVVHPFDKPFNFKDSGPQVFQWFDFQQTKTDVKKLCSTSLDLFEKARASTSTDIWQLQIIISDGVCEDHESLLRLVREARDKKVMLVFVILDGINQKESILDMSQVNYVPDAHGGTSLKVTKYLDSFPFEFYVVVKNINELPQMLSLILRQYFSEISSI